MYIEFEGDKEEVREVEWINKCFDQNSSATYNQIDKTIYDYVMSKYAFQSVSINYLPIKTPLFEEK